METWREEIEQVTMEKWSRWKSRFLETNRIFFALALYYNSETREETGKFSIEQHCTGRKISMATSEKQLNCVFLEKSEFPLLGFSMLFALFDNLECEIEFFLETN